MDGGFQLQSKRLLTFRNRCKILILTVSKTVDETEFRDTLWTSEGIYLDGQQSCYRRCPLWRHFAAEFARLDKQHGDQIRVVQ